MNISTKISSAMDLCHLPKGLLLLMFSAVSFFANGQTALKYVPSTADMVITVNLQNLDKKVNLAQLQQYDFFQSMVKEMYKTPELEGDTAMQLYFEKLLTEPASLGFDTNEPFYIFVEKVGYDTYITFVQKMGDRGRYEAAVQQLKGEGYAANLTDLEGIKVWQKGTDLFTWNDEVVVNVMREKGYDPNSYDLGYNYDYNAYDTTVYEDYEMLDTIYEEGIGFEEEVPADDPLEELPTWEESDSIQFISEEGEAISLEGMGDDFTWVEELDTAAFNWALKVMNRDFLQPITRNERFALAKGKTNDVHFWMDYGFFMDNMNTMQQAGMGGMVPGNSVEQVMSAMGGMMDVMYGDTYVSMGLNFEDGRMAIRSQVFFNEDMKRFYKRSLDTKFNKKMLRYVKGGDELFGYFYLNYNIKNTIEETKALLYKIFDATPQYGQAAADAMKIIGIFIDEEAIGNLLKGDLMVSVSGIQTVEVTSQIYDYDADFNFITKDTTMQKQVPIFTALASYGNGNDIQKFIDLGLHSNVLTKDGKFYRMAVPGIDGQQFYLAKHDGLLIFTNNQYLMQQNLEKGFSKKLRLSKNHKQQLCEKATVMHWNIPNTIRAAAGSDAESNVGMMGYLNNLGKEFHSFDMSSSKKVDNAVESELFLNMTNKGTNALQQFFNFVNDIYLEAIGGAKI